MPEPIKKKHAGGRPDDFTQELADEICKGLAQGKSLRTVTNDQELPSMVTVFAWFRKYPEFLKQYERAKQESADAMAEEIQELGDFAIELAQTVDAKASSAVVSAVKLKADNMKWLMAKMKPKKYGEKLDVTSDGKALPTPIYGGKSALK